MIEGKTAVVTGGIREMMEPIINAIPLGRMGQPEKISSAFLFLSSDMPSYRRRCHDLIRQQNKSVYIKTEEFKNEYNDFQRYVLWRLCNHLIGRRPPCGMHHQQHYADHIGSGYHCDKREP